MLMYQNSTKLKYKSIYYFIKTLPSFNYQKIDVVSLFKDIMVKGFSPH